MGTSMPKAESGAVRSHEDLSAAPSCPGSPTGPAGARPGRGEASGTARARGAGEYARNGRSDAELIGLCDRLIGVVAEETETLRASGDDADWEAALNASVQEWREIEARIYAAGGPATPDGLRAVARAVLATADKDPDGSFICRDLRTWLAIALARYFAEGAWA